MPCYAVFGFRYKLFLNHYSWNVMIVELGRSVNRILILFFIRLGSIKRCLFIHIKYPKTFFGVVYNICCYRCAFIIYSVKITTRSIMVENGSILENRLSVSLQR